MVQFSFGFDFRNRSFVLVQFSFLGYGEKYSSESSSPPTDQFKMAGVEPGLASKPNCQFLRSSIYSPQQTPISGNYPFPTPVSPSSASKSLNNNSDNAVSQSTRPPRATLFQAANEAATQFMSGAKSRDGPSSPNAFPAHLDGAVARAPTFARAETKAQYVNNNNNNNTNTNAYYDDFAQQRGPEWVPDHVAPRRLSARDEYAAPFYPRQGGGSLQQHHYDYNLSRNQSLPLQHQQATKPPLGDSASIPKPFSAVIKPPGGSHDPGAHSPLGKTDQQRQQLQYLNQPAYQPIQRMLANSVSIFSDASLISRIIHADEVCVPYLSGLTLTTRFVRNIFTKMPFCASLEKNDNDTTC